MDFQPFACPNCGAPFEEIPDREIGYIECNHCHAKFQITYQNGDNKPEFTEFENILQKINSQMDFLEANARLKYIDGDIQTALKQCQILDKKHRAACNNFCQLEQNLQNKLDNQLMSAIATSALALFGWYEVIFKLENTIWYYGLGISILLSFWVLILILSQLNGKTAMTNRLSIEQAHIAELEKDRTKAKVNLLDYNLEKELCIKIVRKHRVRF